LEVHLLTFSDSVSEKFSFVDLCISRIGNRINKTFVCIEKICASLRGIIWRYFLRKDGDVEVRIYPSRMNKDVERSKFKISISGTKNSIYIIIPSCMIPKSTVRISILFDDLPGTISECSRSCCRCSNIEIGKSKVCIKLNFESCATLVEK
jgi:hypothetical protein